MKIKELKNSKRYVTEIFNITDKDLIPIARSIRTGDIEIITEFTLQENGIALAPEVVFKTRETKEVGMIGEYDLLLEKYPQAHYFFFDTGVTELELEEPFRKYGGLISFRGERGHDKLTLLVNNTSLSLENPLTGEPANFAKNVFDLIQEFNDKAIAESIKAGDMTESQKEEAFDFSKNIHKLFAEFLNFSIRTESGKETIELEPNLEAESIKQIKQSQAVTIEHLIMPKSEIFKTVIDFKESDFTPDGMAIKEIKYKAGKETVTADIAYKKPIEDNLDQILLFPIDTKLFKPIVMQQPLNMYDGKVFKAICTLIDFYISNNPNSIKANKVIQIPVTLTDIHHAMGYKTRLSKAEADKLRNSVLKLSTTQIHYDWSQEREARHIVEKEAKDIWGKSVMFTRDALYMLEAEHSSNIAPKNSRKDKKGNPIGVEGFIIKAIPPIYAHAKLTKYIANIPIEWFDIKSLDRINDKRNSLIQGLTERISTAKYFKDKGKDPNKENYNVIVLDEFFIECGILIKNKQRRYETIRDLELILKEYKEKGIIKNFKFNQRGKNLRSIKFFV